MDALSADESFLLIETVLSEHLPSMKRRVRMSFAVSEDGPFLLDTGGEELVTQTWQEEVDVTVVTNRQTLSDLVLGKLDHEHPTEEHLLVWGGDASTWQVLSDALQRSKPALAAQIAAMRGDL